MNERLEDLMYRAGLTAQGCWDNMDQYDREAIEKFAELIVKECCDVLQSEVIQHDGYGYNQFALHNKIKKHFGVKE